MKANEAPEKLYLNWTEYPLNEIQVEYTRTDAFIEKARKWFEQESEYFEFDGIRRYAKDDFEDFENYMRR